MKAAFPTLLCHEKSAGVTCPVPSENSIHKVCNNHLCRLSRVPVMEATYLGLCNDLPHTG